MCVFMCVWVCSAAMFSEGGGAQERGGVSVLPRATYTLSPGNSYHGDVRLQRKGNDRQINSNYINKMNLKK